MPKYAEELASGRSGGVASLLEDDFFKAWLRSGHINQIRSFIRILYDSAFPQI